MKKEINFTANGKEFHATVFIWEEYGNWDVTECYYIDWSDDDDIHSVYVDCMDYTDEIEDQIREFLPDAPDGYYGGYDTWEEGYANSL